MCQIFSASIIESAGFTPNEPVPGLNGWIVDRQGQTAFYKIIHNLHLTNPADQLKVFVSSDYKSPLQSNTSDIYNKSIELFDQQPDYFLVRSLEKRTSRPEFYEHSGPFTFVAILID